MAEPNLDINLLLVFDAVYETRSVTAAAARLRLSQSATSHALGRLRERLGDPLFVRIKDGMQPTPYAEHLALPVSEALNTLRASLRSPGRFDARASRRRFHLFLSDVGQMVLLPRLLAYLKEHAPHVTLQVSQVPMADPGVALERGEVDMAVGHFVTLVNGFRQRTLFQERYLCAVRKGHPAFRSGMTLRAFEKANHAIADASGMADQLMEHCLASQGVRRTIRLTVPQFMALPIIVATSDLLVIMPGKLAEQFRSLLSLQVMELPVPVDSYDIRMYWHERFHRDAAITWLRNAMISLFADAVPS
ncbi:MAG: LysR family transcriptional regulator [Lautropia sp.]